MTCVLSATVMPAKTTRTRRRLSSQRNRNPSLNEGEAKGPRNMSSKTGFILSSSLQLATSKPTSQYTTHSWNTSSLVHVWAEPLACLLLDEGMARAVREKREEGSPIHNKRPWCITPLSNRSFKRFMIRLTLSCSLGEQERVRQAEAPRPDHPIPPSQHHRPPPNPIPFAAT